MQLAGFLGTVQKDFESVISAEYSESATISDGTTTVVLPCFFDEPASHFDPDTQSHVIYPASRMAVAETMAPNFNLRRGGLSVMIRTQYYKVRASDWEFDGLGGLWLYLDRVKPTST
jgi:hypothetical protein